MEQFKDANGRDWHIKITVGTVKAVRDVLHIDLTDMRTIKKIGEDVCLLVDCLYVCCQKEATESNITDEQFGESMAGDALDSATDAFLNELINFSPAQKGNLLRKTLAKTKALLDLETVEMEKRIESLSYDQLINSQE